MKKKMASLMKYTFLSAIALLLVLTVFTHRVHAEDDDEREYEDDDRNWDVSDDFVVIDSPEIVDTSQAPITTTTIISPANDMNQGRPPVNITHLQELYAQIEAKLREPRDNDTDFDGVPDNLDLYIGMDDRLYIDSDQDSIVDAYDLFPGQDDLLYIDADHDGIKDAFDSNPTKPTDMDHDGIDDADDPLDNRPLIVKILSYLGFY